MAQFTNGRSVPSPRQRAPSIRSRAFSEQPLPATKPVMNDKSAKSAGKAESGGRDYSETLFLPQTDFPMRAGLPQREPEILARWQKLGLYHRLRAAGKSRKRFVLHD